MEQITLPLLNHNTSLPQSIKSDKNLRSSFSAHEQSLEDILNGVLPDSREENKLQKARRILGETAKNQSDDEVQTFITELQYLIDSWFDSFEQQVFEGSTLKQLLREG